MAAVFDPEQRKRLTAFRITEADLTTLRAQASFAAECLPPLLERLHSTFAAWPEIQAALMDPAVHRVRVEHWVRVASGQLDDGFMASAERLASAC